MFQKWKLWKRILLNLGMILIGCPLFFYSVYQMKSRENNYDYSQIKEYQAEVTDIHINRHRTTTSVTIYVELLDGTFDGARMTTIGTSYPTQYEVGDIVTVYADDENIVFNKHALASVFTGGRKYFALMIAVAFVKFFALVQSFGGKGILLFILVCMLDYFAMAAVGGG